MRLIKIIREEWDWKCTLMSVSIACCVVMLVLMLTVDCQAKTVISTTQTRRIPQSETDCVAYAEQFHVRAFWACDGNDCFCVRPVQ